MTTISISGNSNDSNVIFNSASASIADSEKVSSLTDSHSGGNELEVWAGLTANGPECYIARLIDDELHILDLNDVIFKTEDYTTEGLNVNSIIFHPEFVKVDPNNYLDQMVNLGKKEKWNSGPSAAALAGYDSAYGVWASLSSDGKHYDVYEWDKTGTMGPIGYDKLNIITHRGLDGRRTLDVYYRVSEVIVPGVLPYGPGAWFNPGRVPKALLYYNNTWLPSPLPLKKNQFSIHNEELRIKDIFKNTITLQTELDINRCFRYEFDAYIADASSNLTASPTLAYHPTTIKSNSNTNSILNDFPVSASSVVPLPDNEEVAWMVCSNHEQSGHFSLLVIKTPTSTKSSLFNHIDLAEVSYINHLKNASNKNLKLLVHRVKRLCFNTKLALESMDN